MDQQNRDEPEEEGNDEEPLEVLTQYFRRISRGRIVDLPRWVQ